MERHGDHRSDLRQIHHDHAVVVRHLSRIQLFIFFHSAVNLIKLPDLFIGPPDRGKTGRLRSHHIDADPEISAQRRHARPHEFHHLILHISVTEHRADDRQRHVLRADPFHRFSRQVHPYDARHIDVVSLRQQLLDQLRTTFAHGHCSQRPVTGMGIGTKDHPAAAGHHLSGILVNDCLMRRYIDTAVLLGTGQTEHVIVFIDRTAYRAQRIVAVGQHIGNGKSGQSRCPRRLYDTHESDIVRSQFIKSDLKPVHVSGSIMRLKNTVSHRIPGRLLPGYFPSCLTLNLGRRLCALCNDLRSVNQIRAAFQQFNHDRTPLFVSSINRFLNACS